MIQLLMVIVYKLRWWFMDTGGLVGPYVVSAQRQEHVNKIIKRIAKFCNNNNPEYIKFILQYLDIHTIVALEQNFVDDNTITKRCKRKRKSILINGETPENIDTHYRSEFMPEKMAHYFKLIEQVKKSSQWPQDLRKEYIDLFELDENKIDAPHLCMNANMDEDYIIYDDDDDNLKQSDEPIDAANSVCLDDIKDSAEYLQTMENKINAINATEASISSESTAVNIDVNMSNHNVNCRKRAPSNIDMSDEPPSKKHRATTTDSNTNPPTKQSLQTLKVVDLKEQYIRPFGLKVGGRKSDLIKRILKHYKNQQKKSGKMEIDEVDNNAHKNSSMDNLSDKNCICGAMLSYMKIRNIYGNRNYIMCKGICREKITNGRKFVYHCETCLQYDICEDCANDR
eukprot:27926_1